MTTTHLHKSVLITAILDTGEEKNVILSNQQTGNRQIYKVKHEGFVSVEVSPISLDEIKKMGIKTIDSIEIDLNKFWLYKPRQLDYFSGHENN